MNVYVCEILRVCVCVCVCVCVSVCVDVCVTPSAPREARMEACCPMAPLCLTF
jgi:hypothetical protein